MKIELTIQNSGERAGTVGWLAQNAERVSISTSTTGKRGAWLKFRDDTSPVCIVLHDPYDLAPHPEGDSLELLGRHADESPYLPFPVTDACWESVRGIAEQVREIMQNEDQQEQAASFKLIME